MKPRSFSNYRDAIQFISDHNLRPDSVVVALSLPLNEEEDKRGEGFVIQVNHDTLLMENGTWLTV